MNQLYMQQRCNIINVATLQRQQYTKKSMHENATKFCQKQKSGHTYYTVVTFP